jgi:hypothetical protein
MIRAILLASATATSMLAQFRKLLRAAAGTALWCRDCAFQDGDQSFQAMVITDSTDRDHAQQTLSMDAAANTTDDCICAGKVLVHTVRIAPPMIGLFWLF